MKKIHFILLLLSTVFYYGQVSLVSAIEDKEYKVNQKFTLTFILEINGSNLVQQTPIRLPDFSKFDRLASGSEQNTVFLENVAVNQIIFQQVLVPKVAGEIKIGSAIVTVNGKIYKTEPFEIIVQPADRTVVSEASAKIKNDLYLNIEIADKEVYQNEPVIAVLKAYSKNINNFRKVKNVELPNQNDLEFSTVNFKKAEIDYSKNGPSSQILAVYLIFPKKSGNLQLQPTTASLSLHGKKIVSNKVNFKVKSLPANAPRGFKNAVGDFKVNFETKSTEKVEANKPVNIRLTVSGEGNMENLLLPIIQKSSDYEVFQPKISKNIKIDETGIKGEIFADYILVPKKAGVLSILTNSFSYFNPKENEYVDLGENEVVLNVVSLEEILSDRTPLERVNVYTNNVLETVDNPVITTKQLKVEPKKQFDWSTSLLNLILFLGIIGILILINNHQKNKKRASTVLKKKKVNFSAIEVEKISDFDLENNFGTIRRMLREKNFDALFSSIKELDTLHQNAYNTTSSSTFAERLERVKGSGVSEEYRTLSQKIQIEKFAPVKNEDYINDLVESIIIFYTKIAK